MNSLDILEFRVNPVLSTSPAYSAGDVLFDTTFIQNTIKRGRIVGVSLLDKDALQDLHNLYILKSNVAFGTINAAPTITDADAENVIAKIPLLTAGDSLVGSRIQYTATDVSFILEPSSTGLYVASITTSTITHTTASAFVLHFRIEARI